MEANLTYPDAIATQKIPLMYHQHVEHDLQNADFEDFG